MAAFLAMTYSLYQSNPMKVQVGKFEYPDSMSNVVETIYLLVILNKVKDLGALAP